MVSQFPDLLVIVLCPLAVFSLVLIIQAPVAGRVCSKARGTVSEVTVGRSYGVEIPATESYQ